MNLHLTERMLDLLCKLRKEELKSNPKSIFSDNSVSINKFDDNHPEHSNPEYWEANITVEFDGDDTLRETIKFYGKDGIQYIYLVHGTFYKSLYSAQDYKNKFIK